MIPSTLGKLSFADVRHSNTSITLLLCLLKVNYQERFSAGGRIPRTALRREMGPTFKEMGVAQLVHSALEPMFEPGYASRCQVGCYCTSVASSYRRATVASSISNHTALKSFLARGSGNESNRIGGFASRYTPPLSAVRTLETPRF